MRPVYAVIVALMVTALMTAVAIWQCCWQGVPVRHVTPQALKTGEYSRALRESSAVISDASTVLHEVMTQRQQKAQEGEVRREQLREITATDECATFFQNLTTLTGCANTERATARALLPVHSGGTRGGHGPRPSLNTPPGNISGYGATASWMHWKPATH